MVVNLETPMKKITNYFILFTGGDFVWKHINKQVVKRH